MKRVFLMNPAFPFPLLTASHSEVKGQGHPQSGASEAKAAPALFYQGRLQEGIPPCVRAQTLGFSS